MILCVAVSFVVQYVSNFLLWIKQFSVSSDRVPSYDIVLVFVLWYSVYLTLYSVDQTIKCEC